MRLSLWVFVCLFYLQCPIYGLGRAQAEKRVTISGTYTLYNIFKKIETQTGKRVYYTNNILNDEEKITINAKNVLLQEVLEQILKNKDLEWLIDEKNISIRKSTKRMVESPGIFYDSTISITAKIVNEDGLPVSGATVVVKGSSQGTTSAADGSIMLKNINANSTIIISNIGFLTKEVKIREQKTIGIIRLEKYVGTLDETQVIAYGQTSRRLNPGNVATISSEEIERQPVNNPLYALQGRIAGVTITPTSGIAGAPVAVQIRGRNSLNDITSNDPLYVIDGLPITSSLPAITSGGGAPLGNGMSPLNFINPNDIASISILKDAEATSIYGSRGANGVILITTKKGRAGLTSIDINFQSGISQIPRKLKMMNTEQYISMRKEALTNDGRIDRLNNPAFAFVYPDLMVWDQTKYTNWQDKMIGRNGQFMDIQSSISGGSEYVTYRVGGNVHRETTVFPGNNSDTKGSGNMTLTGTSSNKKLKITVSTSYLSDKSNIPKVDFTNIAITTEPNAPDVYNPDGSINWAIYPQTGALTTRASAPYPAQLLRQYILHTNNFNASSYLSYSIGNIDLSASFGYNEIRSNSFQKSPLASAQPASSNISTLRSAEFNDNLTKNLSIEPQVRYQSNIFSGSLSFLLGASFQSSSQNGNFLTLYDYLNDALLGSKDAAVSVRTKSNSTSEYKYSASFIRMGYQLQNKYIISLSARRDGSSRFGPNNRFGNFGSLGLAWIFSEESFIRRFRALSYGKLRVSYGTSGNDGIGDYQYLEQYQRTFGNPYQGAVGYQTTGIFNAYYHWETTRKAELGLETGYLKDRLLFSISYFRNRSNNQLIAYPVPSISGPGVLTANLPALVQNSGLEVETNTTNVQSRNLKWTTSFNVTVLRNKLIKYPDLSNSPYSQSRIGQPFWGWKDVYKNAGVDPETGLYQFQDIEGKIVQNPSTSTPPKFGRDVRITLAPKFQGGLGNTIQIRHLQIDFFFQFIKQNGINPLYQIASYPGSGRVNQLAYIFGKQWQKVGDNSEFMQFSTTGKDLAFIRDSDRGYVDASFVRLKNVSIAYNIPDSWMAKIGIRSMRLYFQGQNLVTITSYKGFDPETQSLTTLPPLRTLTAGLQVRL
ncbi:SusC/RagA family TonB-linked outer membrane protein [Chitinophaga filiformis]|uniref:SusC/RagA family TonB-linked outer membrane protein n=1 Tax=Chitinophaga filiformis TaxID=104663 RepID=A0ABY4I1L0_CHIFI|nr:SusC/RagA family TonB-linked outer membrane protein [Chitinophaga filiformis]UPK69722.1 SusC/RagA family TonB-linked outer membrane protein [Chitinophaga filiformis]